MGAMCQVRIAPEGTAVFLSVCGMGGSGLWGLELIDTGGGGLDHMVHLSHWAEKEMR